jgi:hypothetical protein
MNSCLSRVVRCASFSLFSSVHAQLSLFIQIEQSIYYIYLKYNFIMSNHPFEQVGSFQLWSGSSFQNSKRPQQHLGTDGATILSHDDEDCFHPMAKRVRFEGPPSSPGAVSLTTACTEQDHEIFMEEHYQHDVSQEWWKKKPKQSFHDTLSLMEPRRSSLSTACCFICNQPSVAHPPTVASNLQHNEKLPVKNSLLNYFSTTRSSTTPISSSTSSPQQHPQPHLSSCSFCDRQSCLACSTNCQECQQRFCTLCTTTDYSWTIERSFCLDCAHTANGGDAMAID